MLEQPLLTEPKLRGSGGGHYLIRCPVQGRGASRGTLFFGSPTTAAAAATMHG